MPLRRRSPGGGRLRELREALNLSDLPREGSIERELDAELPPTERDVVVKVRQLRLKGGLPRLRSQAPHGHPPAQIRQLERDIQVNTQARDTQWARNRSVRAQIDAARRERLITQGRFDEVRGRDNRCGWRRCVGGGQGSGRGATARC